MTAILTTLASLNSASGQFPDAGLIADAAGDLFGTTATGGAYGYGTVFELVNNGVGAYTPVALLSFNYTPGVDGSDSGVIADPPGTSSARHPRTGRMATAGCSSSSTTAAEATHRSRCSASTAQTGRFRLPV